MKELQSDKLRFVPFDGKSEDHAKVLYLQRVACGWNEDLIEEWTEAHEAGSKGIYWLVSLIRRDGARGSPESMAGCYG